MTAPRVPAAALSAPGRIGAAYLDGSAGTWPGAGRRRATNQGGDAVHWAAPGSGPLLREEVVSALPFPRRAQTWGALRSALHGGARGAPRWGHTRRNTWRTTPKTRGCSVPNHRVCSFYFPPLHHNHEEKFFFIFLILGKVVPSCFIPPLPAPCAPFSLERPLAK